MFYNPTHKKIDSICETKINIWSKDRVFRYYILYAFKI